MAGTLYTFRRANQDDAEAIAQHRAWMFRDMRLVSNLESDEIFRASVPWFERMLSERQYMGWLADCEGQVVAGGGVHLRALGPMPGCCHGGRAGHIANLYTMASHRRQGLARSLMKLILAWAEKEELTLLTLSASEEGRPLYRALGFSPTADMQIKLKPLLSLPD